MDNKELFISCVEPTMFYNINKGEKYVISCTHVMLSDLF